MSINIEIQDGKSALAKIFICHGAPPSMAGKDPEDVKAAPDVSAGQTRSPIARDLLLLFKRDSDWIYPVQTVRLTALPNDTDIVGVKLKPDEKWTPDLINQAKGMFERRITPLTGVTMPSAKKNFTSASDKEVRAVLMATLPSEVYRDNPDPDNAIIIRNIDRNSNVVEFEMTQECAKGLCGPFAVQSTIGRIGNAMDAHYGIPAVRLT